MTEKQQKYLQFRLEGLSHIEAVKKAYPNLTKGSLYVISYRLKKNKEVNEELRKYQQELREKTANKEAKFIDILKEFAPPVEVAKKLAELIFANDKRTSDSAIEKWLKLSALYPDTKIGIYRDYEVEREKILTRADLEKLKEPRDENLPLIEEGEIEDKKG
jgi:hypothetical protein